MSDNTTILELRNRLDSMTKEVTTLRNAVNKNDGWKNILVGLAGKMDKTKYTTFGTAPILTDDMLSHLYCGDGFAKKIVSTPSEDMTRKWIKVEGKKKDEITKQLFNLDAVLQFNIAIQWMRLYGGSLLLIGAMDGKPLEQPLNERSLKSIAWLYPIERSRILLDLSDFDIDPTSSTFGKVKVYTAYIGADYREVQIHRSRVLEFWGEPAPTDMKSTDINLEYWGMSIIQEVWEILKVFGSNIQSVANILYEFIIGKYKISGLAEKMAAGQESEVITRMEIIEMFKSVIHAILLDADGEDYIRDAASVAGLAELLDRFMIFVAAVAEIPVTKLFGRSPAGMNATGESDIRNYYDMIASEQQIKLRKPIQRLIDLLSIAYANGTEHVFKFNSLYEMTPKEKADVEKTEAEADHIRIEDMVISNEEVRKARFPQLDNMGKIESEE